MYQALYRKYRPRRFEDVAGQEHITDTLRRQIVSDRLSHAYLFVGTRGTGKTTCAKILSRAVNCQNSEDGEPCNKCFSCVGIEDGSILDVLELDAASNNSVDNVRALRDEAIYSPAAVKKRVYIVDEVHMLSMSAFNALLKILEEPPEHILFILATTELHKVPATIQSRCQKFSFKRLLPKILAARLSLIAADEGLALHSDAADRLSVLADGSMRDGISLLDQCASMDIIDLEHVQKTLGLAGNMEISSLILSVADHDMLSALATLDELYNDGRDMASLPGEMAVLMRDLLVYKLSRNSGLISSRFNRETLSKLSDMLTHEQLFFYLDTLKNSISTLGRSDKSKLAVEMCLIKMCRECLSDDINALISRISLLEAGSVEVAAFHAVSDETNIGKPLSSQHAPGRKSSHYEHDRQSHMEIPAIADDCSPTDKGSGQTPATFELTDSVADSGTENNSDDSVDGDFWAKTLELIRNEPSVHALLGNSSMVQARLENNALIISVAESFTANIIKSEFSDLIRKTAGEALGRNVSISVEVDRNDFEESKHSKLENLNAFDIVNFE